MAPDSRLTALLHGIHAGDKAATEDFARRAYPYLHEIAERVFRERPGHTLQPTILLNDALIHLLGADVDWKDRAHFLGFAARKMRQLLIDHARTKNADKRTPPGTRVCVDDVADLLGTPDPIDVEKLENALTVLEKLSELAERQAQGVVLRVFGRMTDEEVAYVLGCSETTAKNDWRAARSWLRVRLSEIP